MPDPQEEQRTGNPVDSLARPLLCTTPCRGPRPGKFERILYQIYEALQPLIIERLGEEHALLFAEPVLDPETGAIRWYAPVAGEAIPYAELVPEDQAAVDTHLNKLLFDLMELARKLQAQRKNVDGLVAGQLLQIQLDAAFVDKQNLYVVGYQPIVACWTLEARYAGEQATPPLPPDAAEASVSAAEATALPALEVHEVAAPQPIAQEPQTSSVGPNLRRRLSARSLAPVAAGLVATLIAVFGISPRQTVVGWLDRLEALKAREQTLLRVIARYERARASSILQEEPPTEPEPQAPAKPEGQVADPGFYQPAPEPLPPFESASGPRPLEKLAGAVVLLHFWKTAGEADCAEITSFVSMANAEPFDALRADGAEAYLVTMAESVERGSELLRACGVQDPLLLRDPEGKILARLSAAVPPVTIVYDKEDDRVLATYSRRIWNQRETFEELRKILLLRVF